MGLKLEKHGSLVSKSISPGPGTYDGNYKTTVTKDPNYTLKGRYAPTKVLNVPGPGTYSKTLTDKKTAPSYGFGSSP